MNTINNNETFIEKEWVVKYDKNPIVKYLQDDNYRIVKKEENRLYNGFYKIKMRIIGNKETLKKIEDIMFKHAFLPYVMYYKNISDMKILNRCLDIGRSVIFNKHNIDLSRPNIDTSKKVISFYYDNGEKVYIDTDSLLLDNYVNYKLIFDYNIKPISSIYKTVEKKITLIDQIVPVVNHDFEPEEIIDDMNVILNGYRENNVFEFDIDTNLIQKIDNNLYQSDIMTKEDIEEFYITDTIPRLNTKSSFGSDLLLIRLNASIVYQKLFDKDSSFDYILILSDGSLKVPVIDFTELEKFEEELTRLMTYNKNVYSVTDDLSTLIAIRVLSRYGYIGMIANKYYLVSDQIIPIYDKQKISKITKKIQKYYKKHCSNIEGNESLEELAKMEIMNKICYRSENFNTNILNNKY